jgi:hypothetical protein
MFFPVYDPNRMYSLSGFDLNNMYHFAENVIFVLIAFVIIISVLGVVGAVWTRLKVKRAKNRLRVLANYVDDKDVARRISEIAEDI